MENLREKLIKEWPNCDHDCPNNKYCCPNPCTYRHSIKEKINFTKKEKELIRSLKSTKNGFLGTNGCKLPIELRPIECLKYNCKTYNI